VSNSLFPYIYSGLWLSTLCPISKCLSVLGPPALVSLSDPSEIFNADLISAPPQKQMLTSHKYARYPGFGFEVPIMEFDFAETGGHRIVSPTPTIDELLYGTHGVDSISRGNESPSNANCRWYHLPVNHRSYFRSFLALH